jgi:predicted O-methyltransferase YrrM
LHDAVSLLRQHQPTFHYGPTGPASISWPLEQEVLEFLSSQAGNATATLETGSGHSTVVLLSRAKQHFAIAPDANERDAIVKFCGEHGIDITPLRYFVGRSVDVLPTLSMPPLDIALIDGDHAFPVPFMDWFYVADSVRRHGLLLVDDIQLRTGHVLRQFLQSEPEWRHVRDIGKTSVFEKLVDGPVTGKWWEKQPWAAMPYALPDDGLRQRIAVARVHLRLRSRLRASAHRLRPGR